MLREIVTIDEELCDGCGLCIPSCHEGALRIVNGMARLVSDRLCDGLGACLGHCPRGAIRIEQRDASAFDELAVSEHLGGNGTHPHNSGSHPAEPGIPPSPIAAAPTSGGCPGSRFAAFETNRNEAPVEQPDGAPAQSELRHWPVQLRLVPTASPAFRNAKLLVAADCVPFAYPDFHKKLLRDHAVVIACPKLDDTSGYVEKLTEIIRQNDLKEITIAHMQVPCCTGILMAVLAAREAAGSNVRVYDVLIGLQGDMLYRKEIPSDSADSSTNIPTGCQGMAAKGDL